MSHQLILQQQTQHKNLSGTVMFSGEETNILLNFYLLHTVICQITLSATNETGHITSVFKI